ncbi:MAG: DNA topoisomerase IV subunit A [Candidatus Nanopelagicales bacterium]
MAAKSPSRSSKKRAPEPTTEVAERIVDIDVGDEMRGSFLEYAYSVIYSRALPDARDGLKPVQRRILFQMAQMGLRPDRGHVKSARVVGEVMGRLHPHGDSAIYDALVRMAQPFSLRLPLIDGHGNFGSLDDGPAAMRYTECRLDVAASALVSNLDENVVDFEPNYDGREQEPAVLPAAMPMLLINGADGIAVGMATKMPPHNVVEVCAAAKRLIKTPGTTLKTIMKLVPGPDLPTGGQILGLAGIEEAYRTGKGSFRMRASTRIEQVTPRRKGIVVDALPYRVGPEGILAKIKELVQAKKIDGIADLVDLTDGEHGLQLVIEIKNGYSPEAIREHLFKLTQLEESFSINNVALVNGQPKTLGLVELLQVFIDHRIDVVRRRSQYRLTKAEDRLHLVDGLLLATLNIDDVVALIRSSDDAATAKDRLMNAFDLSDLQATYILDMPLRRLTKYSTIELESERDSLNATIKELKKILNNQDVLEGVVIDELDEAAKLYGTPRRTELLDGEQHAIIVSDSLEIPDEPCTVVLTAQGLVAKDNARQEGADTRVSTHALHNVIDSSTRGEFGLVTNKGRALRVNVTELPMAGSGRSIAGTKPRELVSLERGERVVGIIPLDESAPPVAIGTKHGVVKRLNYEDPGARGDWEIISLKSGDEVIGTALAPDTNECVFVTSNAHLLHFPASAVRPQGRGAGGMAGIKLGADASAVFFGAVDPSAAISVITAAGASDAMTAATSSVKYSEFGEFPAKGRATGGVRCHKFLRGEDVLTLAWVGAGTPILETGSGKAISQELIVKARDASGEGFSGTLGAIGGHG